MRRISLILALASFPGALAAGPGVISVSTGVTGTHSSEMLVSDDPGHGILAEARVLAHGPYMAFIVELGQRQRTGQISRAMHGSAALDFDPARRAERFCNGAGACTGDRLGTIFMSQEAFERAAEQGLEVVLVGSGGRFPVSLPAQLFAEARQRATWLD